MSAVLGLFCALHVARPADRSPQPATVGTSFQRSMLSFSFSA